MDVKPYYLPCEAREPFPMKPGSSRTVDSEYVTYCTLRSGYGDVPLKAVQRGGCVLGGAFAWPRCGAANATVI